MKTNLQFFGGRGASGGYGGGKLPARGKDIWSLRHDTTKEKFVDNINKTIKDIMKQYNAEGFLEDAWVTKRKQQFYAAMTWGGELIINKEFTDTEALAKAYAHDIKAKFHPPLNKKTAEQSMVAHELGHALTNYIHWHDKEAKGFPYRTSKKIVDEARALTNSRTNDTFAKKISGYARTNPSETIAEAVSDVYCNGSKAKAESKAVVRILKKNLRRVQKQNKDII